MATRSLVGEFVGEDDYRGVYVHMDGYPEGVGNRLIEEVMRRRGDIAGVLRDVMAEPGWSHLFGNAHQEDEGYGVITREMHLKHGFGFEWLYLFRPQKQQLDVVYADSLATYLTVAFTKTGTPSVWPLQNPPPRIAPSPTIVTGEQLQLPDLLSIEPRLSRRLERMILRSMGITRPRGGTVVVRCGMDGGASAIEVRLGAIRLLVPNELSDLRDITFSNETGDRGGVPQLLEELYTWIPDTIDPIVAALKASHYVRSQGLVLDQAAIFWLMARSLAERAAQGQR